MAESKVIDLSVLPSGSAYEKTYGLWLDVFQEVAHTPADTPLFVLCPPASWVPLLLWLGAEVAHPRAHFDCDALARRCLDIDEIGAVTSKFTRTEVEVLSAWRPETVDALYKCDAQWLSSRTSRSDNAGSFVVTTNGGFYRKEVLSALWRSEMYTPTHRKVVLVPCSADKPYPSLFQQYVLDMLPAGWYMAVVSTVLGIVPHEIALHSPQYDAGLPYHWRLFTKARRYFRRVPHDVVIVLADFNSEVLREALRTTDTPVVDFLLPIRERFDYGNLSVHLPALEARINHWDSLEVWR